MKAMQITRVFVVVVAVCLALSQAGCDAIQDVTVAARQKTATEERTLSTPHVTGSAVDVHTDVGAVEVTADPSAKEVQVTAKLTAFAPTEEEAQSLLKDVEIKLERREDGTLEISSHWPDSQTIHGGCSFEVRLLEANGAKVRSGNGAITLAALGGAADVHTGIGAVKISDQAGKTAVHTGNGAIQLDRAGGDCELTTDIGSVTVRQNAGTVTARSGNGAIHVTSAKGSVVAKTSIGAVTVDDVAGDVIAKSGNGQVVVAQAQGTVSAHSDIGQVKVEQVSGTVEASSGNGSIVFAAAKGSASPFTLKTSIGSVAAHLPASASGNIQVATDIGQIAVKGPRKPDSVTGERSSKKIVLGAEGPSSKIHSGNGSITLTLD
jgi:hypothetical protein